MTSREMQRAVLQLVRRLGQKGRTPERKGLGESWNRDVREITAFTVKLFSTVCLEVLAILTKKTASSPPLFKNTSNLAYP